MEDKLQYEIVAIILYGGDPLLLAPEEGVLWRMSASAQGELFTTGSLLLGAEAMIANSSPDFIDFFTDRFSASHQIFEMTVSTRHYCIGFVQSQDQISVSKTVWLSQADFIEFGADRYDFPPEVIAAIKEVVSDISLEPVKQSTS